jgi:hypothetical protein
MVDVLEEAALLALDFLRPKRRIVALAARRGGFGVAGLALLANHDVQKCPVGNGKLTHKNDSPCEIIGK